MHDDRRKRVEDLFHLVIDLSPSERASFLDEHCANDDVIRREVEALLSPSTAALDSFLESGAIVVSEDESTTIPKRIGHYTIIRKIGEGGMGVVYEATQERPKRTVALKVIRAGYASPKLVRRFEHEAHVLGQLQHIGIAQIYEAGTDTSSAGVQPFFVMEFIRGDELIKFAAERGLSVRQRLELIARICDAVQHAHQKGVIHRDLKPANVLVVDVDDSATTDLMKSSHRSRDDVSQPKILDFGIARATDGDMQTVTMGTDIGQLIGTVPYMSPEQVTGDPANLDIRTDVYSLGVIAYELLSGDMPYNVRNRTIPEIVRVIRDDEPTRLSTSHSELRGDIETIVAKAIEKDKERRYQSAAELAADIRRFLCDEPIQARPATAWYQFQRFAKRNRALVGGAVSFLALLIIALVVTGTLYISADNAENIARREADRATAINKFLLQDMLASPDPSRDGHQVTVVDVMRRAADKIPDRFSEHPQLAAELHRTVGAIYSGLGVPKEGLADLRRAAELYDYELGPHDPITLDTKYLLAGTLLSLEHLEESETLLRSTLKQSAAALGSDHEQTLYLVITLGDVLQKSRQYEEADQMFRQAVTITRLDFESHHKLFLAATNRLSASLLAQKKLAEAEPIMIETLEGLRKTVGPEHPNALAMMNNIGSLLIEQNKHREAEVIYTELVEVAARVMPRESWQFGILLGSYGHCLEALNKDSEAEARLEESLDILQATMGEDHYLTERVGSNLYNLYYKMGRNDEAIEFHQQAVERRLRIAGPGETESVVRSISEWETALEKLGVENPQEVSVQKLSLAAKNMRETNHPRLSRFLENTGWAFVQLQRFDEAEHFLTESLDVYDHADMASRDRIAERITIIHRHRETLDDFKE